MTVRGFLWVLQLYPLPTLPIQIDRNVIAETTVASHVYDPYNDPSPIFFFRPLFTIINCTSYTCVCILHTTCEETYNKYSKHIYLVDCFLATIRAVLVFHRRLITFSVLTINIVMCIAIYSSSY